MSLEGYLPPEKFSIEISLFRKCTLWQNIPPSEYLRPIGFPSPLPLEGATLWPAPPKSLEIPPHQSQMLAHVWVSNLYLYL